MSDVTLSAAVRSSLLSLQNTTNLIDRTQNRLSSGLRVASAIDDPVAFFQAKTLSDRAFDFTEKKDTIDQGVSTVSAALEGIEAIEAVVRQLKGIANSLKSATGTQFADLITQYNSLRTQIGSLADDASYQGTNLVNNTSETLTVSFSENTGSLLSVRAVNVRESGLAVDDLERATANGGNSAFNYAGDTDFDITAGGLIVVTFQGTAFTFNTGGSTSSLFLNFTYGTVAVAIFGNTAAALTITQGTVITLTLSSKADSNGLSGVAVPSATGFYGQVSQAVATGTQNLSVTAETTNFVTEGDSAQINVVITDLDSALATLRSNAQTLGSNVALLQTRLDFTVNYTNTLEIGSSKLTLADINEEGANLLALQTRQQLGISALAFAGQAEQGILALFR